MAKQWRRAHNFKGVFKNAKYATLLEEDLVYQNRGKKGGYKAYLEEEIKKLEKLASDNERKPMQQWH